MIQNCPFSLAFATKAFGKSNKAILSFDLDNVLNIVSLERKSSIESYLDPWLMLRDERSEIFSIIHHDLIYRKFQVAVITNREANSRIKKSTLDWLNVDRFSDNDAFAVFMRPEGVEHDKGVKLKAATVKAVQPILHVDDNKNVLHDKDLDNLPMRVYYNSYKESGTITEFFLLSILNTLEQS